MHCPNCGALTSGNFCSDCGARLAPEEIPDHPVIQLHWSSEKNYRQLINYPEVRALIARYADTSSQNLTADQIFRLVDLVVKPVFGISLKKVSDIYVPIYKKVGIKTGKSSAENFAMPAQEVIVKVLCSLAKNGYPLENMEQAVNGLVLLAKIPSDMKTWGGNAVITIEEAAAGSRVVIGVRFKGQLIDWGKSRSVINKILDDIRSIELP